MARVKLKRIETSICSIINIKLSTPVFGLPMDSELRVGMGVLRIGIGPMMGPIPIRSIDTVDTCKFGVSIDTSTKYR